jgi:cell division protein FtsN
MLPFVKIPVEYIIISGIVFLVLMVFVYALGIEKGKVVAERGNSTLGDIDIDADDMFTQEIAQTGTNASEEPPKGQEPSVGSYQAEEESGSNGTDLIPEPEKDAFPDVDIEPERTGQAAREEMEIDAPEELSLYTIQLASFKKRELARRERSRLREKGIDARIARRGEWFQVFANGYNDIGEAKKAKEIFSYEYSDCFIRKER